MHTALSSAPAPQRLRNQHVYNLTTVHFLELSSPKFQITESGQMFSAQKMKSSFSGLRGGNKPRRCIICCISTEFTNYQCTHVTVNTALTADSLVLLELASVLFVLQSLTTIQPCVATLAFHTVAALLSVHTTSSQLDFTALYSVHTVTSFSVWLCFYT